MIGMLTHPSPMQKILVIVGPTASGKTDLSIRLAKEFNGEVICVDSRTVYRGMDIGTAKTMGEWKNQLDRKWTAVAKSSSSYLRQFIKAREKVLLVDGVSHWGVDLVDPDVEYSVAEFKDHAENKIKEIVGRGKLPILVGGTGLWIDVIVDNLDLPDVAPDPALRAGLEERSLSDLLDQFDQLDPVGGGEIDRFNKRRLIRALEVCIKSGQPFSQMKSRGPAKYDPIKIGIDVDREVLRQLIDERVDRMIAEGLVDEARALKMKYGCEVPAMSGIGYRQICFFLDGKVNLPAAIEDIKKDTWAFAKRQLSWFRRDQRIHWFTPPQVSQAECFSWLRDQLNLPSLS